MRTDRDDHPSPRLLAVGWGLVIFTVLYIAFHVARAIYHGLPAMP